MTSLENCIFVLAAVFSMFRDDVHHHLTLIFLLMFFLAVVLFTDRVFSVFTLLLKFSTSTFY